MDEILIPVAAAAGFVLFLAAATLARKAEQPVVRIGATLAGFALGLGVTLLLAGSIESACRAGIFMLGLVGAWSLVASESEAAN